MRESTTAHEFYYNTEVRVSAAALADSLLGLETTVRRSGAILTSLIPGLSIAETEVLIESIELASYKENFLVRLVFGRGDDMENHIDELRKALRLDKLSVQKLITLSVVGTIAYGAHSFLKDTPAPVHNTYVQIGKELNMESRQVEKLIDEALHKKREEIRKGVVRLAHPGGNQHAGSIIIDRQGQLEIPPEMIAAIPRKYEAPSVESPTEDLSNVRLEIRAGDMDSDKKGWAAIAPDLSDQRVPLHIPPEVDRTQIVVGRSIVADMTVIFRLDDHGGRTPKLFVLRAVKDPSSAITDYKLKFEGIRKQVATINQKEAPLQLPPPKAP